MGASKITSCAQNASLKDKLWTSIFGTTYNLRNISIKIPNATLHKSMFLISSLDISQSIRVSKHWDDNKEIGYYQTVVCSWISRFFCNFLLFWIQLVLLLSCYIPCFHLDFQVASQQLHYLSIHLVFL